MLEYDLCKIFIQWKIYWTINNVLACCAEWKCTLTSHCHFSQILFIWLCFLFLSNTFANLSHRFYSNADFITSIMTEWYAEHVHGCTICHISSILICLSNNTHNHSTVAALLLHLCFTAVSFMLTNGFCNLQDPYVSIHKYLIYLFTLFTKPKHRVIFNFFLVAIECSLLSVLYVCSGLSVHSGKQ